MVSEMNFVRLIHTLESRFVYFILFHCDCYFILFHCDCYFILFHYGCYFILFHYDCYFILFHYDCYFILFHSDCYFILFHYEGLLWPWSYGSWIYNYLCNQWLSPLMLWVRISIRARCTTSCDKVCQSLATGRWFSPSTWVSSTNKTNRHNITEILFKVALNTITLTPNPIMLLRYITFCITPMRYL